MIGRAFVNTDVQQNTAVAAFGVPTHVIEGTNNNANDVVAISRAVRFAALQSSINLEQRALPDAVDVPLSLSNLHTYSEQAELWDWGIGSLAALMEINTDVAPDPFGGNATDEITHTLLSPPLEIRLEFRQNVLVTANTDYNISIFSKQPPTPDEATHLLMFVTGSGVQPQVFFDLRDGGTTAATGGAFNIESTLDPSGFYRCSYAVNSGANTTLTVRHRVSAGAFINDDRFDSDLPHSLHCVGMQITRGSELKPYQSSGAIPKSFDATVVGTPASVNTNVNASTAVLATSGNNATINSAFVGLIYPTTYTPRGGSLNMYQTGAAAVQDRIAIGLMTCCHVIGFDSGTQADTNPPTTGFIPRTDGNAAILGASPDNDHYLCTYHNVTEAIDSTTPTRQGVIKAYIDAMPGPNGDDGWWYNSSNQKVLLFANQYGINISSYVGLVNGLNYGQWYADRMVQQEYVDPHIAAGVKIGGPGGINVFIDNYQIHANRSGVDWDNDGNNDDAQDYYDPEELSHLTGDPVAVTAYSSARSLKRDFLERVEANNPGMFVLPNTNQWADDPINRLDLPESVGELRNCILEYRLNGNPAQAHVSGGWSENNSTNIAAQFPRSGVGANGLNRGQTGTWYKTYFNIFQSVRLAQKTPGLIVGGFQVECLSPGSTGPGNKTTWSPIPAANAKWHMARWGMCTAWIAGAMAGISGIQVGAERAGAGQTTPLFDEYGLINGSTDYGFGVGGTKLYKGWMGTAKEDPPTTAKADGSWQREFQNALVILNPDNDEANPPITIDVSALPGGSSEWTRFSGDQDPSTNSGSDASSDFSLSPINAIVLPRKSFYNQL